MGCLVCQVYVLSAKSICLVCQVDMSCLPSPICHVCPDIYVCICQFYYRSHICQVFKYLPLPKSYVSVCQVCLRTTSSVCLLPICRLSYHTCMSCFCVCACIPSILMAYVNYVLLRLDLLNIVKLK